MYNNHYRQKYDWCGWFWCTFLCKFLGAVILIGGIGGLVWWYEYSKDAVNSTYYLIAEVVILLTTISFILIMWCACVKCCANDANDHMACHTCCQAIEHCVYEDCCCCRCEETAECFKWGVQALLCCFCCFGYCDAPNREKRAAKRQEAKARKRIADEERRKAREDREIEAKIEAEKQRVLRQEQREKEAEE